MANIFKPRRSSTLGSIPTIQALSDGELAVNSANKKIYLREGNNIIALDDAGTLNGLSSASFLQSESDTLATVTARGATTSTAITLSSVSNHYSGHLYYDSYDINGNHYPHFLDGSNGSGTKVNWRLFNGTTNTIVHYWATDYTLFANSLRSTVDVRAPIFYDSDNTNYYLDPASTSVLSTLNNVSWARIGGAVQRSASGLTVGFTNNTTFASNSDVTDSNRMISVVNESATTNAMSVLGFRINPNGDSLNAMMDMKFVNTGATNTSTLHFSFNHGGGFSDRVTFKSDGNVGINSTSPTEKLDVVGVVKATDFNTTSDERLKTNISTIKNSIEKVSQIRGVNFEWKDGNRKSAGVIAQEIEKVLPELVRDTGTKTVNYNGLIGVLIEAIKELSAEIDTLKEMQYK